MLVFEYQGKTTADITDIYGDFLCLSPKRKMVDCKGRKKDNPQ